MNNFSSVAELNQCAANFSDTLDKVNDYILQNQWALPVAGAVGGAGLGAIGGLALGDKKKSKLRRAIEGGLIGTGIGGLGGLAAGQTYANQYKNKVLETLVKEVGARGEAKNIDGDESPYLGDAVNEWRKKATQSAYNLGLKEKFPDMELAAANGEPVNIDLLYKPGFKKGPLLKYVSNILNRNVSEDELKLLAKGAGTSIRD